MTFAYTELVDAAGNRAWRPLINVRVIGPGGGITIGMLVDSGADETQLPRSILSDLGVVAGREQVELTG